MNDFSKFTKLLGLSDSFVDKMGISHLTTNSFRRSFLDSISINSNSNISIDDFIPNPWISHSNPILTFFKSDDTYFDVYLPISYLNSYLYYSFFQSNIKIISHRILLKKEFIVSKKSISNSLYYHFKVPFLPPKNFGYFDVAFSIKDLSFSSFLIYSPDTAYLPDAISKKHEKLLGIAIQLYAIRSNHNMGVGDFYDLKQILKLAASNNIDFVSLNPLGVMYAKSDIDVSPYRTFSREFINYLYIDLYAVKEFKDISIPKSTLMKIQKLRDNNLVDYHEILQLKLSLLSKMYKVFSKDTSSKRFKLFSKFKDDKGENLFYLSLFETLMEYHDSYWQNWPSEFKDLHSPMLKKFASKHKAKIDFYSYCHWIADTQLKNLFLFSKKLNMKIGLYLDMPIGASSNGAELWQNQELFAHSMDIGTPPDTIRPKGQTWGLVPLIPHKLVQNKYSFFINLFRQTMAYAGAIRIDHALGLMRLFWVNQNKKGAYVYYDFKTLIAILSIESHLNKCIIIAEDLGNVPNGFSDILAKHHFFSNKILFRQKDKDGAFLSTKKYPYLSLSQVSTHDQPTSYGFWLAQDILTNFKCALFPKVSQFHDALALRQKEREAFYIALKKSNSFYRNEHYFSLCLNGLKVPHNLEFSFNMYGANTNSALFLIRIEDMVQQIDMQNVPSTVDTYPNWRIKLPINIDKILKPNSLFISKILACRK